MRVTTFSWQCGHVVNTETSSNSVDSSFGVSPPASICSSAGFSPWALSVHSFYPVEKKFWFSFCFQILLVFFFHRPWLSGTLRDLLYEVRGIEETLPSEEISLKFHSTSNSLLITKLLFILSSSYKRTISLRENNRSALYTFLNIIVWNLPSCVTTMCFQARYRKQIVIFVVKSN